MYAEICPVCKYQISYNNNKYSGSSEFYRRSNSYKKSKNARKDRFVRTSTPVSDYEYNPSPSFSDSVTEFFYQSWKSGLHSDTNYTEPQVNFCRCPQPIYSTQQQVCYLPQVVYVNTVIYQPYMPSMGVYVQQIGYRPDGTYGIIPPYWPFGN